MAITARTLTGEYTEVVDGGARSSDRWIQYQPAGRSGVEGDGYAMIAVGNSAPSDLEGIYVPAWSAPIRVDIPNNQNIYAYGIQSNGKPGGKLVISNTQFEM